MENARSNSSISFRNNLAFEVHVDDIIAGDDAVNTTPVRQNMSSSLTTTHRQDSAGTNKLANVSILDTSIKSKHSKTSSQSLANPLPFFKSNFDETGYVFDGIKIEIDDIENNSLSNITTTQSLKRCKDQVLRLYYILLCFIGWRPFYKEHYYRTPTGCKIVNFIYPLVIILLLFYSYIYDIVTCQGKLNVAIDIQSVTQASVVTAMPIVVTNTTWHNSSVHGSLGATHKPEETNNWAKREQCGHIVTTYILPSLMHLFSYALGFFYFRISENEQLYSLMEKVFLAVNQSQKIVSQDRVIKRLKIFIFLGILWVVLAMSLNILFSAAYGYDKQIYRPSWLFVVLRVIALVIMNSIYLAVVVNHATQCELIIFYVHEIKTRLEEKSVPLKDAMAQILDIRMAIGNLNSTVSKMTTLVTLTFLEKFIIGLIILIMNKVYSPLAWTYRALFPISWFVILAFTLIQVTRLNSKCSKLKQIALSARVYGYHTCSRDELDSFLLFISNAKLRGKLFGIPLKPSYLLGSIIIVTFTIIILFQTSVITSPDFII